MLSLQAVAEKVVCGLHHSGMCLRVPIHSHKHRVPSCPGFSGLYQSGTCLYVSCCLTSLSLKYRDDTYSDIIAGQLVKRIGSKAGMRGGLIYWEIPLSQREHSASAVHMRTGTCRETLGWMENEG